MRKVNAYYGKPNDSSSNSVDEANKRKHEIENKLSGKVDELNDNFMTIFDLIKTLDLKETNDISTKRKYIVLFIALYQLYYEENKIVDNEKVLKDETERVLKQLEVSRSGSWKQKELEGNINDTKTFLREKLKDGKKNIINKKKITEIENVISMSNTESIYYDLKQGFHNLDEKKKFNSKNFEKIMKTICAISNNGKKEDNKSGIGHILIGIADSEPDKNRIEELYLQKGMSRQVNNWFVTGLNGESQEYHSFDDYYKKIANLFEDAKTNFTGLGKCLLESVDYYGRYVLMIKVYSSDNICTYNNKIYYRVGSETQEANPMKVIELMERFK